MARARTIPLVLPLLLLLWTGCFVLAADASRPPGADHWIIPVQLVAVFEPKNYQQYSRILQKAVNEANAEPDLGYQLEAKPLALENHSAVTVEELCKALDGRNVSVILSIADLGTTLAATTVGSYAGLPVVGIAPGYFDHTFTDLHKFFQPLNPTLDHLAEALSTFLLSHSWLSSTFIIDDALTSQTLFKKLQNYTQSAHPHSVIVPLTISRSATPTNIFGVLSDVVKLRSRVLLVHCEGLLLKRIFEQARRLNMDTGDWIWILMGNAISEEEQHYLDYPVGVLGVRLRPLAKTKHVVRMSVRLMAKALQQSPKFRHVTKQQKSTNGASCGYPPSHILEKQTKHLFRELKALILEAVSGSKTGGDEGRPEASLRATVDLLNLVEMDGDGGKEWHLLGNVTGGRVAIDAVIWPGNTIIGPSPTSLSQWRIVTAHSPPFVLTSEALANHTCLTGVPCLRVATNNKDELSAICADYQAGRREGDTYNVTCCYGYSIDLLVNVAKELRFDYVLYLVADGRFGGWKGGENRWDGMVADLMSGAAHMAFAPLSVTAVRSRYVDFSVPYYFSGVTFLTSTKFREVPLLAFLYPFSAELWIAIFASLHATAVAAAVYEWLSPFGLNPWGRQRTKNFSLASALWVTWSLLFSHLVAFKAPKSWPNKVLINLWGCFSVIFLASYTANIAALFAGLFFQTSVNDFQDQWLLTQRLGTARSTAAESYVANSNRMLWEHMRKYNVSDNEEGVRKLRNEELDLLVGDKPLLDFYRGQEPGCTLRTVGHILHDDTYAIGMTKGSPLKEPISTLIAKYHENGYLDYLTAQWYHGLPCMRTTAEMYRPMRLSIRAVAGVFIMLCLGMIVGCIILFFEHFVYKHVLPELRQKPKGTIWRSPNMMFFSQKLYRFINCVELVSPHHSAKELVNNLRTGQITSLFQKSIKRKEHEQRRRRKSKAQFFEMIQEIRRVQKEGNAIFSRAWDSSGTTANTPDTPGARPSNITEEEFPDQAALSGDSHGDGIPIPPSMSYFSDDSCVRLIERVGKRSRSSSCDSSDDDATACLSPVSASLSELCKIEDETKGPSRQSKVHSYDDLKCWTRPPCSGHHSHHSYHHHHHHHSPYPPTSLLRGKNNFLRDMPMTKFDFFDLPLRLNDARLKKVSKEDIVFLWQTSERELRRRLQQALKDKYDLERRLAAALTGEAEDRPP